mmetsp:Transcript_34838/g.82653  ORF Transcript_34838/g.82653 Transcript_34838/m.82653 type:complete len:130 (-) Transcript_34838:487-876(-)
MPLNTTAIAGEGWGRVFWAVNIQISNNVPGLMQVQGANGSLLRERATIGNANSALDATLSTATEVASSLGEQRQIFEGVTNKLTTLGSKFPVVNGLLNAIRRKKSKDTIILAAVIAACTLFTIIYWLNK